VIFAVTGPVALAVQRCTSVIPIEFFHNLLGRKSAGKTCTSVFKRRTSSFVHGRGFFIALAIAYFLSESKNRTH
jgi:hypothetical protein